MSSRADTRLQFCVTVESESVLEQISYFEVVHFTSLKLFVANFIGVYVELKTGDRIIGLGIFATLTSQKFNIPLLNCLW